MISCARIKIADPAVKSFEIPQPVGDKEQPFLVRIAGVRRPTTDFLGEKDGALFFAPRAALTGVNVLPVGEVVFSDIAVPKSK